MDPSALHLPNGHTASSPPPSTPTATTSASKPPPSRPTISTNTSSSSMPSQTAPRIDPAPIFETLKSLLTPAQLSLYRSTMSLFLTAQLSLPELHDRLPFLKEKREILRAHNRFITVVYTNASREPPASGEIVAGWVGETGSGRLRGDGERGGMGGRGDWGERRVKREVMGISARERRRLKEVGQKEKAENVEDMLGSMLSEYHLAKQVRPPDMPPPRSAGLSKTNWTSEITPRYTLPLSSESGEFPDLESIRARMLPICYESGIPGGCTIDTASFMAHASEIFVKEILTTIITRVRSNCPKYIQTDAYRRAVHLSTSTSSSAPRKRKHLLSLSSGGRGVGLGAGQAGMGQERPRLGMHDVRLSLTLGDNLLTQLPLSMKKIMAGGWYERDYEVNVEEQFEEPELDPDLVRMLEEANMGDYGGENGVLLPWDGAEVEDRRELRGILDDCLAIGM